MNSFKPLAHKYLGISDPLRSSRRFLQRPRPFSPLSVSGPLAPGTREQPEHTRCFDHSLAQIALLPPPSQQDREQPANQVSTPDSERSISAQAAVPSFTHLAAETPPVEKSARSDHAPSLGHSIATLPLFPTPQQKATHTSPQEDPIRLRSRIEAARSDGRALDTPTQQRLEQGLGADLSGVRIHTSTEADRLTRSVNALAFTTGPDIFFRRGMYHPGSSQGLHLLTHEATHVVQQATEGEAGMPRAGSIRVNEPGDRFEQAAETQAARITMGNTERSATFTHARHARVLRPDQAGGNTVMIQRYFVRSKGNETRLADEEVEQIMTEAGLTEKQKAFVRSKKGGEQQKRILDTWITKARAQMETEVSSPLPESEKAETEGEKKRKLEVKQEGLIETGEEQHIKREKQEEPEKQEETQSTARNLLDIIKEVYTEQNFSLAQWEICASYGPEVIEEMFRTAAKEAQKEFTVPKKDLLDYAAEQMLEGICGNTAAVFQRAAAKASLKKGGEIEDLLKEMTQHQQCIVVMDIGQTHRLIVEKIDKGIALLQSYVTGYTLRHWLEQGRPTLSVDEFAQKINVALPIRGGRSDPAEKMKQELFAPGGATWVPVQNARSQDVKWEIFSRNSDAEIKGKLQAQTNEMRTLWDQWAKNQ